MILRQHAQKRDIQTQTQISPVLQDYLEAKLFGGLYGKGLKDSNDRTLGREAEFALMQLKPLGLPGDNITLIQLFEEDERYQELVMAGVDGKEIVRGFYDSQTGFSFITEAGKCTIEILFPVFKDLWAMYEAMCKFMAEFIPLVLKTGQVLIGVGIQPAVDPANLYEAWFPGLRYHLLRDLFLEKYRAENLGKQFSWLSQDFHDLHAQGVNIVTITSSDQPHVELHSPEEMVLAYNVMQVLTPIFMALFRNSPVYGINHEDPQYIDPVTRAYASRELLWRAVNSGQSGFVGFYKEPMDIVKAFAHKQCYFQSSDNGYVPFDRPFFELPDSDIDDATWAFLCGTDYSVGRRTDHNTFELRSVCQQSPLKGASFEEQFLPLMAPHALNLGVILSLKEIWAEIQRLKISMKDVQNWYIGVQKQSLDGLWHDQTFIRLMYKAFGTAWNALFQRGFGEEEFLQKLKAHFNSNRLHFFMIEANHDHIKAYGKAGHFGFRNFLQSVTFGETNTLF